MTAQNAGQSRRTRARIAASVVVLGAAASVAGLGTFGTFTDSTTPVVSRLDSGVLSIALTEAADTATLSLFDRGVFLAGDAESSPIDLVNDGTAPLAELRLGSVATASSVLDADPVHGLQLAVDSCSEAWTPVDGGWTCGGTTTRHYSGPIVTDVPLTGAASLAPGGVDHLLLTAGLPSTTSAELVEGATSSLDFVFRGVQRDGAPR
ncbi:hypothetical protein E4P41_00990 [Geodermatophilus sp. DF01-2]|uniref:hypothetical protein n=1 Tax=Geodermatophilus sp. DF01-2 TaxID=2559610 RepID=UPI001073B621|nr:hypothetical protein [Geodermatophilus sp. DF01_2]TFV64484.1 hypothetical protein E4P41_00990 [Geodermatophilus sp. DF01_2]